MKTRIKIVITILVLSVVCLTVSVIYLTRISADQVPALDQNRYYLECSLSNFNVKDDQSEMTPRVYEQIRTENSMRAFIDTTGMSKTQYMDYIRNYQDYGYVECDLTVTNLSNAPIHLVTLLPYETKEDRTIWVDSSSYLRNYNFEPGESETVKIGFIVKGINKMPKEKYNELEVFLESTISNYSFKRKMNTNEEITFLTKASVMEVK